MQWCSGLWFSSVSIVTPVFHTHLRLSNNLSEGQASEAWKTLDKAIPFPVSGKWT